MITIEQTFDYSDEAAAFWEGGMKAWNDMLEVKRKHFEALRVAYNAQHGLTVEGNSANYVSPYDFEKWRCGGVKRLAACPWTPVAPISTGRCSQSGSPRAVRGSSCSASTASGTPRPVARRSASKRLAPRVTSDRSLPLKTSIATGLRRGVRRAQAASKV